MRITLSTIPTYFFFNDTATTEIYTLSLHDALPISDVRPQRDLRQVLDEDGRAARLVGPDHDLLDVVEDRKSTRLNSSHVRISYAVFCLKKKKKIKRRHTGVVASPSLHR